MINSIIKQAWINALKSGEYKHGQYALHSKDTFCCLGVLCDIYRKELQDKELKIINLDWVRNVRWGEGSSHFEFLSNIYSLPIEVKQWAGGIENFHENKLASINDDLETVDFFKQIEYIKQIKE